MVRQQATKQQHEAMLFQTAQKTENPDFIKTVEKKFPNKEHKILIGCSDGRAYSMDALMQLDEAGYTNIAGSVVFAPTAQLCVLLSILRSSPPAE